MNLFKTLVLLFSICCLVGCQTTTVINLREQPGQQIYYKQGNAILDSKQQDSQVQVLSLEPQVQNGSRITLALNLINNGNSNLEFKPEGISVVNQSSEQMKVFSHEELVKEEKTRQNWSLLAAAVSGAADAYSASQSGYSTHTGSIQSTTNSNGRIYNTNGTYRGTTYDPNQARIASELASQKSEKQIAGIVNQGASKISTLDSTIARRNTIFPGKSYTGVIVFDAPRIQADEQRLYKVHIPIGGDTHVIDLSQEL
ncbi:MAG: hypothetical protein ABJO72_05000 [Hyphomicrobiales bacterium]